MLPPLPRWEREGLSAVALAKAEVRVKKALADLLPSGPCSPLDPFRGAHPLQQTQVTPRSADLRASESLPVRYIGRRSHPRARTLRMTEAKWIIAALANKPTACYTGTKPKFRILCGSI